MDRISGTDGAGSWMWLSGIVADAGPMRAISAM